jgi:hypothetical protein
MNFAIIIESLIVGDGERDQKWQSPLKNVGDNGTRAELMPIYVMREVLTKLIIRK